MTSADNAKGGDAEAVVMSYDESDVAGWRICLVGDPRSFPSR